MKKLLAVLFIWFACFGGFGYQVIAAKNASAPDSSYLIDEDCETGATPADWTDHSIAPDWAYGSGVEDPLAGTYSVALDYGSHSTTPTFAAQSTAYIGFQFQVDSLANTSEAEFVKILDNASAVLAYFSIRSTDVVRVYHGSANNIGTTTASIATKYYVWLKYVAASADPGGDGVLECRIGTTGTYSSAAVWANVTTGTSTGDTTAIRLMQFNSDTGGMVVFDNIIVSANPIGDM